MGDGTPQNEESKKIDGKIDESNESSHLEFTLLSRNNKVTAEMPEDLICDKRILRWTVIVIVIARSYALTIQPV